MCTASISFAQQTPLAAQIIAKRYEFKWKKIIYRVYVTFNCEFQPVLPYSSVWAEAARCGNNFLSLSTRFLQQPASDWLKLKAHSALRARSPVKRLWRQINKAGQDVYSFFDGVSFLSQRHSERLRRATISQNQMTKQSFSVCANIPPERFSFFFSMTALLWYTLALSSAAADQCAERKGKG